MKILTNIYHVSADNGEKYEDKSEYSATVHARHEDEAVKKGIAVMAEKAGIPAERLDNVYAELAFSNVELEVATPDPFTVDVDGVEFTYHYDLDRLEVKTYGDPGTISKRYLKELADYLAALVKSLE